jgi:hypothetical protein
MPRSRILESLWANLWGRMILVELWQVALLLAALVAIILVLRIMRRLRGRRKAQVVRDADLAFDVEDLPAQPRPRGGPQLEFYNVPVRLAAIVIAPAGRDGTNPPAEKMPDVMDEMVPGLRHVLHTHQPEIRRWPPQLSTEGFTRRFFTCVTLPGDRGKGSPWCAIAGRFESGGESYMAGIVCCADANNNLAQVPLTRTGGWLDVLRVRREA